MIFKRLIFKRLIFISLSCDDLKNAWKSSVQPPDFQFCLTDRFFSSKHFCNFFVGTGRVIYCWKSLDNYISSILNVFAKSLWFKSSFEKNHFFQNRKCESYFVLNFQTVCRNWANKMALESWWKSASSIYVLFFLILYYLKVIWKPVKFWAKRIFVIFFKWFVRLTQMIRRWKAM